MTEFAKNHFGNPSSIHHVGREAKRALDDAKSAVSQLVSCHEKEILFTSGGTEANNLAVLGVVRAKKAKSKHIITTKIEHKSVLESSKRLQEEGVAVTFLNVDKEGRINLDELKKAMRPDTVLVSIMAANNEVGTVQDLNGIVEIVKKGGALLHCDMVQALGKMPLDLSKLRVDLASISAHKIGGPKGVGALIVKEGIEIEPLVYGGKQGAGIRPGTENMLGIVGFGEAARLKNASLQKSIDNMGKLRSELIGGLKESLDFAVINGDPVHCLPNTVSVSFPGCDVDTLLMALDGAGVAVSVGSACDAGIGSASHVLTAMGLEQDKLDCTLRLSLGESTTPEEISEAVKIIVESVAMSKFGEAV